MSRAGNPYDNAKCESLLKILKQGSTALCAGIWKIFGCIAMSFDDYNPAAFAFGARVSAPDRL